MTASVSMVIFNKLVMQTFPYPNLLLIIQNSITIALNVAGTSVGTSHPHVPAPFKSLHARDPWGFSPALAAAPRRPSPQRPGWMPTKSPP